MPQAKLRERRGAIRWGLSAAGFLCVGLAVAGIFLPLVPTVPLLLLAAACFARSSDRFYRWLVEHAHLGPMIRDYLEGAGMPRRAKATAICLIWLTIPLSALFLVSSAWLQVLLFMIAAAITIYLISLPSPPAKCKVQPSDEL